MKSKIIKAMEALKKHQALAQQDPHRPEYHFLPPANWMNDPNGTIYYKGFYHLFYQHNPYKPRWGRIHWGHARSKDLVHWEHLPIALAPEPGWKELHCFSGCCVVTEDGTAMIFYTSVSAKSFFTAVHRFTEQWAATGDPSLIKWEKHPQNPILSEQTHHPNNEIRNWRDPYVWKDNATWYMIIAGQEKGEDYGSVYLYRSLDLIHWETIGRLYKGQPYLGKTWECPNYFPLDGKYILVVSPLQQVIYSIGEFKDHVHLANSWFILDHGEAFYATNTFMGEENRLIIVGWIKVKGKKHWAGCLSLPRVLNLDKNDQLLITPIKELTALRYKHRHIERSLDLPVENAGSAPYFGECVEIKAKYDLEKVDVVGFNLIDDEDEFSIEIDFHSRLITAIDEQAQLQFFPKTPQFNLHIFIDKSILEIFINNRETLTTTFYPRLKENNALKISPFYIRAKGKIQIDFWTLRGSSSDVGMDGK